MKEIWRYMWKHYSYSVILQLDTVCWYIAWHPIENNIIGLWSNTVTCYPYICSIVSVLDKITVSILWLHGLHSPIMTSMYVVRKFINSCFHDNREHLIMISFKTSHINVAKYIKGYKTIPWMNLIRIVFIISAIANS